MVTLCTLRVATVLSRNCRADFGRPLTGKVTSHLRDGPGVTVPSRTNIVPLTRVWKPPPPPPSVTPPLKVTKFSRYRRVSRYTAETNQTEGARGDITAQVALWRQSRYRGKSQLQYRHLRFNEPLNLWGEDSPLLFLF